MRERAVYQPVRLHPQRLNCAEDPHFVEVARLLKQHESLEGVTLPFVWGIAKATTSSETHEPELVRQVLSIVMPMVVVVVVMMMR